ncbi:MAG: hypothetical protein KGY70_02315 [Bacteroidales bacterium]|nr:hypothetical protein [Bacteroidales bacterium]
MKPSDFSRCKNSVINAWKGLTLPQGHGHPKGHARILEYYQRKHLTLKLYLQRYGVYL